MTIEKMKIGDILVLGRYGIDNNQPEPIVWVKATPNCDFITRDIVDYLCFDAKETGENGRYLNSGNPMYKLCNLRQFLNSPDETWFHPMHPSDGAPRQRGYVIDSPHRAYDNHFGFLYHFEDGELACLSSVQTRDECDDLIRLPRYEDVYDDNKFKLFNKRGIRPKATETLCAGARRTNFEETSYAPFWLQGNGEIGQCIGRSGLHERRSPYEASGVRPVCTISPNTEVLKYDDVYCIKPLPVQRNVFTDEELLSLLGVPQP